MEDITWLDDFVNDQCSELNVLNTRSTESVESIFQDLITWSEQYSADESAKLENIKSVFDVELNENMQTSYNECLMAQEISETEERSQIMELLEPLSREVEDKNQPTNSCKVLNHTEESSDSGVSDGLIDICNSETVVNDPDDLDPRSGEFNSSGVSQEFFIETKLLGREDARKIPSSEKDFKKQIYLRGKHEVWYKKFNAAILKSGDEFIDTHCRIAIVSAIGVQIGACINELDHGIGNFRSRKFPRHVKIAITHGLQLLNQNKLIIDAAPLSLSSTDFFNAVTPITRPSTSMKFFEEPCKNMVIELLHNLTQLQIKITAYLSLFSNEMYNGALLKNISNAAWRRKTFLTSQNRSLRNLTNAPFGHKNYFQLINQESFSSALKLREREALVEKRKKYPPKFF